MILLVKNLVNIINKKPILKDFIKIRKNYDKISIALRAIRSIEI